MKERENIIELYELYKGLFTEKQKLYFENYYFEDLSLNEIADNNNVSKSLVSKIINGIIKKLDYYESILKINKKEMRLREALNDIGDEEIRKIIEEILYND